MLPKRLINLLLILSFGFLGCQTTEFGGSGASNASRVPDIDRDVTQALNKLYSDQPAARSLAQRARGILVFPDIVKGGFMFGAHYGVGALRKGGRTVGYYNSIAASYGLQAGVQTFGYALFFMAQSALDYVDRSNGWEIGMGPSIVVVDAGMGKSLTTTTGQADVYAFIFDQKGLMAGLGLQGSKITKINP
ncbi:MAG: lipid-binding SYLF domain-containing protein [Methylomonas sp.]